MARAVDVYERLRIVHKAEGYGEDDDYVFVLNILIANMRLLLYVAS